MKKNKYVTVKFSTMLMCATLKYAMLMSLVAAPVFAQPAYDSADQPDQDAPLGITRITPRGEDVPAGRQIVIQFDRKVVPVGRMERDATQIPIVITPMLNCEWRWINARALACQLREEAALRLATRYVITVKPGIRTESGQTMRAEYIHTFITQRPKVTYTRFINWLSPGKPLIQVTLNQAVTQSSLQKSLFMTANEVDDAGAVSLQVLPDEMARELPRWMQGPRPEQQPKPDDRLTEQEGEEARRVWLLVPVTELPLDQRIVLNVLPGLVSLDGREEGVEARTIVQFYTFPEFRFLGVRCTLAANNQWQLIGVESLREDTAINNTARVDKDSVGGDSADENNADKNMFVGSRCSPLHRIALAFSAPVKNSAVRDYVQFNPRLNDGRKDYNPWANVPDRTHLSYPHRQGKEYLVSIPENLKAYQQYDIEFDLKMLSDEFGRNLTGDNVYRVFTAHRSPQLILNHPYAVLEKAVETEVPLYVTNLTKVDVSYDMLTHDVKARQRHSSIDVPAAEDVAFAIPMQVRTLIEGESGVVAGRLTSTPRPPGYWSDPEFFVQVTPFQVHAKIGHFNSLVWVTDLATGQPVKNVTVSLHQGTYYNIASHTAQNIKGITDQDGIVRLTGARTFDPQLDVLRNWHNKQDDRYFLRIEKGNDIALLPLDSHFQVRSSGAWSSLSKIHGHTHAWGTTAQGVYKLGDNIEFKVYVRHQSNKHWVSPQKESYHLQVYDPQQKMVFEKKDITLSEFGAFDGHFKVPEQGAVGWYDFQLKANFTAFRWQPLSVLVSDFTPAPFNVSTELNGERFKGGDTVHLNASASLYSGGAYANAKVRLTARLNLMSYRSHNPVAEGFAFGGMSGKYLENNQANLLDRQGTLSDNGQFEDAISLPEADIYYGVLQVESAVMDDRGKYVASTATADYIGRDRFVGLRNTRWIYNTGKEAIVEAMVVDDEDHLVTGVDITIAIQRREYKAARVKGPGNAYLTQNIVEWVKVTDCRITSQTTASPCTFTPEKAGSYQFIATIKDSKGREHRTALHGWVAGQGYVAWDQRNDATLQIIAEQTDYQVGATARYLVKNPFPGAKALVTVERYGVLDSWVQELGTSTPIIEFPVKADYLPGFYLSVVVVSPRVEKPLGLGNIDLGKPAYRMGYITADVQDPYKQLDIEVNTDRDVYKPRDKVKATIHVGSRHNTSGAPYEIAVAVVDESVLALNRQGNNYYDPYRGFNKLDTLDLSNYSLISRLVGRQQFEKKGSNTGGDGGGAAYSAIRNQFKFISYWNPSIKPDKQGKASIEFDAPDNLTGWRVLAFAVTPDDMMGLGDTHYKVNRPTEIRAVMPNQVIEGDRFKAGFSVMNRTGKQRTLDVEVNVVGPMANGSVKPLRRKLELGPYKKQNIWLPIDTKGHGILRFVAKAADSMDGDGLEHTLMVNKRRSLETAATYGATSKNYVTESIHIPDNIYTDVGGVSVMLAPSVIGNIDGAFRYVKAYPYYCWEQRLTKAVMASSYLALQAYLKDSLDWPDAADVVNEQLEVAANFQAPNGGMAYWIANNQYVSPYLSAYTAIAFNWLRRQGYEIPAAVEEKLHHYLLELIRRDVFPTFFSKGMSSSVRAVALAALAEHGKISRSDIARYVSHVPEMDLFGRAHYLQAAIRTGDSTAIVQQVVDSILGHASQSGGKFQFNEPWDDSYKYILATPLRSNCAVLSSLLVAQQQSGAGNKIADIPFKLVRSITQSRGNRAHFENTQENVFCMNALMDYSKIYESQDPDFNAVVRFDSKDIGVATFSKKSDAMVEVKRPMQDGDAGKHTDVEISKQGPGRLYYSVRLAYDLKEDNRSRINAGIDIRREYSVERAGKWTILESPMNIRRGELVRVDLFVSVPTARHFVVVNDPVPGGLETVNADLATASTVDVSKGRFQGSDASWWFTFSDWRYYGRHSWSFYHKELRHDAARFYADYLPAGNYHLSYTAQAIAQGDFSVMPVHVEEMYDPDVYGKGIPARLHVDEAK